MTELARVRVVFTGFSGEPGIATHYVRKTGVSTWGFYLQTMLNAFGTAYEELQAVFILSQVSTVQGSVDIIEDTTGEIQETLEGDNVVVNGTVDAGQGPAPAGLAVTWNTGGVVAGRHVRGRTFVVPVAVSAAGGDGTPTDPAKTAAADFGAVLLGMMSGLVQPVVWSRPKLKKDTDPQEYYRFGSNHDILTATVADKFAVLRSRRD